jgi:thiamine-phosphate pyrophosphorylase
MKLIQIIDYDTFGDRYVDIARQVADVADIIWFRVKQKGVVYTEAKRLREALPDAYLSLSLDADVAMELGYQAVQLGANSDVEAVREKYPELAVGYSAHSIDEIASTSADFYTLSPIFYTQKDYEVKPIGCVDVREIGKEIYALGGISSSNVSQLRGLGYAGVAGISFYKELSEIKSAY